MQPVIIFFFTDVHSVQGSRATWVRGLLNVVFNMNVRVENEYYKEMEDR